ncbi:MAG: membrane dipeptidase [Oscillospiraceae bacterium]|jgi:membrane dipeptidase|nr:membrane dipeptidase [Oscillospiraceae bacterium]
MFIFDAHCDTLSTGRPLWRNGGHVDIERLRARGPGIQVMAAFGKDQLLQLDRLSAAAGCLNCALLPAVEGGDTIGTLSDLAPFLARNPVFFGLTWNHDNRLAGGCRGEGKGLSSLGRDVVEALEDAGALIDLSHASEQTFWDVLEVARRPPVVTHGCCHALCPHPRNLTDGQLKALARKGGVLGVTFYPPFLTGRDEASLPDVVRHIEHAVREMGAGHVGIGSDFDGCEILPQGIAGTQDLPALIEALPFAKSEKALIAGGSFMRILPSKGGAFHFTG